MSHKGVHQDRKILRILSFNILFNISTLLILMIFLRHFSDDQRRDRQSIRDLVSTSNEAVFYILEQRRSFQGTCRRFSKGFSPAVGFLSAICYMPAGTYPHTPTSSIYSVYPSRQPAWDVLGDINKVKRGVYEIPTAETWYLINPFLNQTHLHCATLSLPNSPVTLLKLDLQTIFNPYVH